MSHVDGMLYNTKVLLIYAISGNTKFTKQVFYKILHIRLVYYIVELQLLERVVNYCSLKMKLAELITSYF